MMPPESEHGLEQVLRAWVKKRRAEQGKDFELHPATRRLLLAEVVRRYPKRVEPTVPWRLALGRLWGRTVSVVGLFAILAVAAWALKYSWANLSHLADSSLDEQRPPPQLAFSLRKRSVANQEKTLSPQGNDSNLLSRLMASVDTPGTDRLLQEKAESKTKSVTDEAVRTNRAEPAGAVFQTAASPTNRASFSFATAPPRGQGFQPVLSPTLATGGVAAFTENLARSAASRSAGGKVGESAREMQLPPADGLAGLAAPLAAPQIADLGKTTSGVEMARASKPLDKAMRVSTTSDAKPEQPATVAVVAALPEAKSAVAVSAPAPPTTLARAGSARPGKRGPVVGSPEPLPPMASAVSPSSSRFLFARLTGSEQFQTVLDSRVETTRTTAKPGRSAPGKGSSAKEGELAVLSRFELTRQGNRVTLTDADGSAYEGAITRFETNRAVVAPAETMAPSATKGLTDQPGAVLALRTPTGGALAKDAATEPFFFTVIGTNRTLHKRVVFSGSVVTVVDTTADALGERSFNQPRANERRFGGAVPPAAIPAPAVAGRGSTERSSADGAVKREPASGRVAPTNTIVLQGRFRVGTKAEQPLRAVWVQP
jgi:hypothetical protein